MQRTPLMSRDFTPHMCTQDSPGVKAPKPRTRSEISVRTACCHESRVGRGRRGGSLRSGPASDRESPERGGREARGSSLSLSLSLSLSVSLSLPPSHQVRAAASRSPGGRSPEPEIRLSSPGAVIEFFLRERQRAHGAVST